jgi:uncharacterized CHY-type Zn-finger protein
VTTVHGVDLDDETRCAHWRSPSDIIAIRFACCGRYYACYDCHAALETHEPVVWPRERFDEPAVLCGVCRTELSVDAYLASGFACPSCGASFNPGCANHYHLYFAPF